MVTSANRNAVRIQNRAYIVGVNPVYRESDYTAVLDRIFRADNINILQLFKPRKSNLSQMIFPFGNILKPNTFYIINRRGKPAGTARINRARFKFMRQFGIGGAIAGYIFNNRGCCI